MKKDVELQKKLLKWYRENARDLPWRRTKDPYRIWVSEIMLQQTQVKTVIPYYERWLKRFPTIQSLGKSPSHDVMKYWAGLGYYRRARMLHEAAKILCRGDALASLKLRRSGCVAPTPGHLPRTASDLMLLPGIGRYTAGAIASIAFGEKVPVLDGNVIRILTRIFAIKNTVDSPQTKKKLWAIAQELVDGLSNLSSPRKRGSIDIQTRKMDSRLRGNDTVVPGDFNQAMMELGATVCFPESPNCPACPLKSQCRGFKAGNPERFPYKSRKEVVEKIRNYALILRNHDKVLLQRQAEKDRWGGLWMFPFWKDKQSMMREIQNNAWRHESTPRHRITVNHGFTKYRIALEVYEVEIASSALRPPRNDVIARERSPSTPLGMVSLSNHDRSNLMRWIKLSNISSLPLPSPHRKIAEEIAKYDS